MIVSEARREANHRNAARSTGPKTPEGKERSRMNALKHGLCASVVVAEDAQLVQARAHDFFGAIKPQDHLQAWLVTQVGLLSLRIERCERIERRVRDKVAMTSEVSWEEDRRIEAALLGERLHERPEVAVEQLRKTPQGCEWMMTRWALLAHAADTQESWTPDQTRLAFDLLGTPAEFREGRKPGAALDFEGRVIEGADNPAAVARREVAVLKERRELVAGIDEASRALVGADLGTDSDPELRRLRRYESSLHYRLRWCLKQIQREPSERDSPRGLREGWLGYREPTPKVELPASPPLPALPDPTMVQPPFCLEPHEAPAPGQPYDIPAILAGRAEKKARRAETRREARRRRLDRLRA